MNIYIIGYLVIIFGALNLIRMAIFLIGSDLYYLKNKPKKITPRNKRKLPKFSVIVPAFNEEKNIVKCLTSLVENIYYKNKLQIIVVSDGSTDNTNIIVRKFIKECGHKKIKLVTQINKGKAAALNNGIINHATGDLVMCTDADSYLDKDALLKAAQYFNDKKVVALAANIKIIDTGTILNLIQRFEYLISYQMKRAHTVFNIEYIIGGIGSVFRMSTLREIGYYDTNTVTEDIDLTMKILRQGNKANRVVYGSDVIAYTESVPDIGGLIKQRYRWKFGRGQTFYKNRALFFNSNKKYTKWLTWFYLPYAIFGELTFILEPLLVSFIIYVAIKNQDPYTLLGALMIVTAYVALNIMSEDTIKAKDKVKLIIISPAMYLYFYVLSFVEYVALIKTIFNFKNIKKSVSGKNVTWEHVDRVGAVAS